MKNNIFISLLVAVLALCYSCSDETVPTNDSIVHDKTKVPTITSNIDLATTMPVDSVAIWDVDIEAFNGIDSIFLNDSVIHTFGDGQLKYNGIEITMPLQEEYEVKLSVKDEIGLETIYPSFTIEAKDRPTITSNVDLGLVMFVDSIAIWDVDIYASNGIDTIFLNGSAIHTYENIRKTHKDIEITMPSKEGDYEVMLSIKDKIGLEAIYPSFTIAVKEKPIVPYDPEQKPIITSNVNLETEMLAGAMVTWDVDISAFNGIDTIFLNGDAIRTYENRQKTHSGIEITMPDQDEYEVILSVKDGVGNVIIYPAFTITQAPYLICDFIYDESVLVAGENDDRRVLLPKYDGTDYAKKNFAWLDAKVKSDIGETNIRFGSPSFNGGTPAIKHADWKTLVGFGATAPMGETKALRFNLFPRKANMRTMLAFDAPLNGEFIADVVDSKTRVFKIDVYVDTKAVHPFADSDWSDKLTPYSFSEFKHKRFALGLANTSKFHDLKDKWTGQDDGMIATLTKINAWETLTFTLDAVKAKVAGVYTMGDVGNNEVNMLILSVTPTTLTEGIPNATYYFRNLRIENK